MTFCTSRHTIIGEENNEAKSHHLHSKGKYSLNLSPWQLMTALLWEKGLLWRKKKDAQTFSKLRVQAGRRAKLIRPPFSWNDAFSLHNAIKTVGCLIWRLKKPPKLLNQAAFIEVNTSNWRKEENWYSKNTEIKRADMITQHSHFTVSRQEIQWRAE